MRTIDLYRGIKPPCHEFDPYANPEYQDALREASAVLEELAKYNVPQELILKIDSTKTGLPPQKWISCGASHLRKEWPFRKTLDKKPRTTIYLLSKLF